MSMGKPRKKFLADSMGGNAAQEEIAEMARAYTGDQESASAPEVGKSTAKEKQERVSTASPLLAAPEVSPACYDFRKLREPEKTQRRCEAVLCDPRFSHGVRAAAALLVLAFSGGPDSQVLSVRRLLSDNRGFSAKVRNSFLSAMVEAGLIEHEYLRGVGSRITLLF